MKGQTCSQNTVAVCSPGGSKIVTSKSIKRISLHPAIGGNVGDPIQSDMAFAGRDGGAAKNSFVDWLSSNEGESSHTLNSISVDCDRSHKDSCSIEKERLDEANCDCWRIFVQV